MTESTERQMSDTLCIDDLSYSERAALTNEDLDKYYNAAIMRAGIVIPPMLAPFKEEIEKLPENKVEIHILTDQFGAELSFSSRESAEAVKNALEVSHRMCTDYEYFLHQKVYYVDEDVFPKNLSIQTVSAYNKADIDEMKTKSKKVNELKIQYDEQMKMYRRIQESACEIREEIHDKYVFACERESKISEYINLYGEYLVYSKGDKTIAQQFLVNNIGPKLSQYEISILTIIDRYETILENQKSTGVMTNEC